MRPRKVAGAILGRGLVSNNARNVSTMPQYLQHLLEEQVSIRAAGLSPAERAAAWRASVEGLPLVPPLSDAAISRESIYGLRG
jgi:hypothetical protein